MLGTLSFAKFEKRSRTILERHVLSRAAHLQSLPNSSADLKMLGFLPELFWRGRVFCS